MSVSLNRSLCVGCGICENVCPKKAISMVNGFPEINDDKCNDCGICVQRCPKGALSLSGSRATAYRSGDRGYYGDGFGFKSLGRGTGYGMGRGGGRGAGRGRGMGRGGGMGYGPSGECICPSCGTVVPHRQGVPCYQQVCPNCGSKMIRK